MSRITTLVKRLAALLTPAPRPLDLDALSLRQWADLPPHHPRCD